MFFRAQVVNNVMGMRKFTRWEVVTSRWARRDDYLGTKSFIQRGESGVVLGAKKLRLGHEEKMRSARIN